MIKQDDHVIRDCSRCCRTHLPGCPGPERFKVLKVHVNKYGRWCFWNLTNSNACPAEQLTVINEAVVEGNEIRLDGT